ncbi:hypothetical protein FT663_01107 [Candidozyma haemuli var. vulneris]|nr:hypothetical protein FT662_00407 [[Candida] haemuloni var. vulneris]KAF3994751.1 hypothetical protein FT663_01107 [[Candida] haemuloni var. vulneris]
MNHPTVQPTSSYSSNMVKFYLKIKAELAGVTDLEPVDTSEAHHEYTFKIECTKCREVHDKPVNINRFEKHDISGSRGEASFVFRCKGCKHEHSASIERTKEKVQAGNSNKWTNLLEIDARGIDFVEFIPEGRWQCVGEESGTKFEEVDLEDAEWYDYDDKQGDEVSVTEVQFDISRA